jgi:hypothetical protein
MALAPLSFRMRLKLGSFSFSLVGSGGGTGTATMSANRQPHMAFTNSRPAREHRLQIALLSGAFDLFKVRAEMQCQASFACIPCKAKAALPVMLMPS